MTAPPGGWVGGWGGGAIARRGLLFGVYTARGPRTCCGKAGSYGHEEIDARTYASWGVRRATIWPKPSTSCTCL
jgi:hypothetical protein